LLVWAFQPPPQHDSSCSDFECLRAALEQEPETWELLEDLNDVAGEYGTRWDVSYRDMKLLPLFEIIFVCVTSLAAFEPQPR
jgi:hypothetical protein